MKKRMLCTVLALSMVLSLMTGIVPTAHAAEVVASGSCGDNAAYTLDSEGVFTVSGTGDMTNYTAGNGIPWDTYKDQIKSLVVEEGITSIGGWCFSGCVNLAQVQLPESLTEIQQDAFYGCESLSHIRIPASVTLVGANAFGKCSAMTQVHITDLDAWVNIDFKDWFSSPMYGSKTQLLLNGQPVTEVVFPEGIPEVKPFVFKNCGSLKRAVIPQGVTSVGREAFNGCVNLEHALLPEGVTSIGDNAFDRCYLLKDSYIPKSVRSIGASAFSECHSITEVVIPEGVSVIRDFTFSGCWALETVTVPETVTAIYNYAFQSCGLQQMTLPDSLTYLGAGVFNGCTKLEELKIPDSVTVLRERSFSGMHSLRSFAIPDGTKTIPTYAFSADTGLTSIRIPASVTAVEASAFLACDALTNVYFYGTEAQWKAITVGAQNDPLTNAKVYYNCDRWQDLVDMGYTLEQLLTQPTLVLDPVCDRDLKHTLENVTVSGAMGQVTVSQPYVIPLEVAASQGVVLKAEGYRDYIIPAKVAATLKAGSEGAYEPYTLKAVMQLDKKDGKPYVSTVFIRETGSDGPYKDARVTEYYAAKDVSYDLIVSAVGMEGKEVAYYIGQNEHKRIASGDGTFTARELASIFDHGKKIYAYAEASDGTVCEPVELKLGMIVADSYTYAFLNSSTFSLFGDDGLKLKVGDSFPILGGLEVGMDCFSAPIGVEVTGTRVRVSIGFDIFSASKTDSEKTKVDHLFKSFKKEFQGVAGHMDDYEKALQRFKALKQKYGGKPFETGKQAFDVAFMGYLEGEIVNGELIFTEGLVSITGKFSTSHTKYALLGGWFPVYVAAGFDGAVTATGTGARVVADEKVPVDFGITLDVKPELWLEGGVGIRNVISLGVYGKGGAPYHVNFSDKYHKWKLTGELGIRGRFLLWSMNSVLLDGEFVLLEEYYGNTDSDLAPAGQGTSSVTVELADRDYLDYDSGWLGQAADMSLFADGLSAVDFRILQTGIYEEAKPQLTKVADKLVLTWIEDDPNRDDFNRMRLVYSVYDPATDSWSGPKAVYDDGCIDANATTAVVDGKLVIAWQKLARTMTAEDFSGLDALLHSAEIYVAVYDPATDTVESVQRITENTYFDYLPIAAAVEGQPAVYYASCADNDLLGNAHTVSVWTAGQGSVLVDGISFVHTMDASGSQAAWITDSGVALWNGTVTRISGQATGLVYSEDGLYLTDGRDLYTLSGTAMEPILDSSRRIGGNLAAVKVSSGIQLYWMETEETGNALYRISRVGDVWSKPVRVSTQEVSISCVDVAFYEGQVLGSCQLTDTDGVTALASFAVHDVTNIALDNWFYFDESQVKPGSEMSVDVMVSNLGTTDITQITFTVTDTLGTNHTYIQPVALPSGSSQTLTVSYPVPEGFTATTLTVTAAVDGDADTSDNTVSMAVGECDLAVSLRSQESAQSKYLITAIVGNDSALTARNVCLTVSVDGEVIRTLSLGDLGGGEQAAVEVQLDALALNFGADAVAKVLLTVTSDTLLSFTDDDTLSVTLLRQYADCEHPQLERTSFQNPSCLEQGYTRYSCVSCGETFEKDYVDALGHDRAYTVTTTPTEQTEGLLTAHCIRCDDGFTAVLPVLTAEHYSYSIVTEPTYTAAGLGRYTWLETAYGEVHIDIVLPELVAPAQRLELVSAPAKLYYSLGEAFDPTGMKLRLYRQDGETELLSEGFTLSGFDTETAGKKTVTVSYEGVSVSFTAAVADSSEYVGQCGNSAWWIYEPDTQTLTVFGTGAMYDWNSGFYTPWADVLRDIRHVTVEDGITHVGGYAFHSAFALEDVQLGSGVTSIGYSTFHGCYALKSIELPEALDRINGATFASSGLESIAIPENVTFIGNNAFSSCAQLKKVTMGDRVEKMESYVFADCWALEEIRLSESLTYIGSYCFRSCEALTKISIPAGVTYLGSYAFQSCGALEEVTIGEGLSKISDNTFNSCVSLRSITLPASLKTVDTNAFTKCTSLSEVRISDLKAWCNVEFVYASTSAPYAHPFNASSGSLYLNGEKLTHAVLPEGLTQLKAATFYNCAGLETVVIPEGVKSLAQDCLCSCPDLKEVSLPASLQSISSYFLKDCPQMEKVHISDIAKWCAVAQRGGGAVRYGGELYVGGEKLTHLVIPEGVTYIQSYAFRGSDLVSVSIPTSLKTVSSSAFEDCGQLWHVFYAGTAEQWKGITVNSKNDPLTQSVRHEGVYPHTLTTHLWASCTEYGMYRCSLCGATKTIEKENPVHKLTWELSVAPTLNSNGVVKIFCEYSDFSTYCSIPKLSDESYDCQVLQEATCTEAGLNRYSCYFEEYDITVTFEAVSPAPGHTETAVVTPPTCTEEGFTTYTCTVCGEVRITDVVSATGHTMVADARIDPTCTEPGLTEGSHCRTCGLIEVAQEEISALGHNYDDIVYRPPTEYDSGVMLHRCARCADTWTESIPPLGHTHAYSPEVHEPNCVSEGYTLYTCRCGDSYQSDFVPAWGHSYETQTIAPSCTTIGFTIYTCHCGDSYNDNYLPALGHSEIPDGGDAPTCTEPGLTDGSHCGVCGQILVEQDEIPALGHAETVIAGVPETCTQSGLTEGVQCNRCGLILVEQEQIPPVEHSWDEGTVTLEPTEETEGLRLYTCILCGQTREEAISKLDHVHRYEVLRTEPTCTEEGTITQICPCGHSYVSQMLPMLPHSLVEQGYQEPTCTEPGYTGDMVCDNCGQIQELGSKIEATGHAYKPIVTDPTCTEAGFTTHTCHCGDSYTDEYVPALGHSLSGWILTGSGQIYRTCYACGYDEVMDALPTVTDPAQAIILAVDVLEKHTYEITMTDPVWGNVVCIVEPEGSYTILAETQITDTGVRITLPGSCRIIVVNKGLTFPDVGANNRFRNDTDYLTARGIMTGKLDGTYGLSENIQRRTVAMVLWRLAGEPEVEGKSPFPDVTGGRYLAPVLWAYQNGIITGYTDGTFRPEETISRQHFAVMLHRYAKWTGVELERGDNGKLENFPDYGDMNRRFYEDMQWALDCGLISGKANGTYDPTGFTTRGQMTTVLSRFLQKFYAAQP